jgi:hypothetical protein
MDPPRIQSGFTVPGAPPALGSAPPVRMEPEPEPQPERRPRKEAAALAGMAEWSPGPGRCEKTNHCTPVVWVLHGLRIDTTRYDHFWTAGLPPRWTSFP